MPPTPPEPPRDSGPLLALQVLRALAALTVVVHHAGYDADTLAARGHRPLLALETLFDWTFGVHLFFVISGFIMLRTARGFGTPRAAAVFALRRAVRVVPLYWLLTTLVIAGATVAPGLLNAPLGGPAVILGSVLFIPVHRPDGSINPVLGQGWTLDYEMFFYALFAAALLLPRRTGLAALAATLLALVAIGRFAHPGGAPATVWTGELLLEFLFGMGVGLAVERDARLSRTPAALLTGLGIAAAIALGPATPGLSALSPVLRAGLPATLVVAGAVLGPPWPAKAAIVTAAALGDASYSLYLSHPFVIRLLRVGWAARVPEDAPLALFVVVALAAAVAVALLLYRVVERPMTERLQRATGAGRRPILPDAARLSG